MNEPKQWHIDYWRKRALEAEAHASELRRSESVLGTCSHGINLDREFCPHGCRV